MGCFVSHSNRIKMTDLHLSDLSIQQVSELFKVLNFQKLKNILAENEYSGAMLSEVSSSDELQSIDSRIKPLEAKGWFKEVLKLKEKLPYHMMELHECPVCLRLYSEVDPTTLPCGHTLCVANAKELKQCPVCKEAIDDGFKYAVTYTIRNLTQMQFPHKSGLK